MWNSKNYVNFRDSQWVQSSQFKAPCCCWICLIFLIWYIQKRLLFRKFEIFYLFLNSLFSTFLGRSWSWFMVFKPSILGSNPSILNSATCKLASLRALFQRTYVCFIILFLSVFNHYICRAYGSAYKSSFKEISYTFNCVR